MRGFSGSRSFRLRRLPCRETVGMEPFKSPSGGVGGIEGSCDLTRNDVEVDSASGAVIALSGSADRPELVGGPVSAVGALDEDASESRLESDNMSVELCSLFNRFCIIVRRTSENDGWACKAAGGVAGELSWLLPPNAERFELEIEPDKRLL